MSSSPRSPSSATPQSPSEATRYDSYGFPIAAKGPRPEAKLGAGLLMAGGVLHIISAFLPWYQGGGFSANGFDTFPTKDGGPLQSPGRIWVVVGTVLFVLGLVTYISGRRLWVAITAVVVGIFGLFSSLLGVGAARNMRDLTFAGVGGPTAGAFIGIVSIMVALAGAVQILSKRRR